MSAWWRAVGINYLKYSSVASSAVRKVVVADLQQAAKARGGVNMTIKK